MTDANVRFYAPDSGEVRTLHIETTGAVVNITVGLTDSAGQPVTRIDIVPDGDMEGGDKHGRVWDLWQNGTLDCDGVARLVKRPDLRYDDAAEAEARKAEAAKGDPTGEYFSVVTTGPFDEDAREHVAALIMAGNDEGEYISYPDVAED